jgi:hypothetical protein
MMQTIIGKVIKSTNHGIVQESIQETQQLQKILQGKVSIHMREWFIEHAKKMNQESVVSKTMMINIIQQWKKAWINRINQVQQDTKQEITAG